MSINGALPRAVPSLLHYFGDMEDPRLGRRRQHARPDILLIMFCGVICGAKICRDLLISQSRRRII
ncbi:transposase family protein [Microbulbifer sp. JMSA003]|uniref:transposase family protein n=1 Tax=Microbulbifer sp. JMSA003 TaxID=3243369 RepID=UPI0040398DA5